ncbi:MAG: hypothetical protein ACK502_02255 [Alphaproteobacteria bacterium]
MTTAVLNKQSIDALKKVVVSSSVAFASPQDANDESRGAYDGMGEGAKKMAPTFRPYATAILDELGKNLANKRTLTKEQFVELFDSSGEDAVARVIAKTGSLKPEFISFLVGATDHLLRNMEAAFDAIAESQGKLPPRGKPSP